MSSLVILVLAAGYRLAVLRKISDILAPTSDLARLAPDLPAEVRARLAGVEQANVAVFSGRSGIGDPFIGSGVPVAVWGITMDVATNARDATGGPVPIQPFDAADLHDWLARTVPVETLPNLRVTERLYVNGYSAELVPDLVPHKNKAPATVVPSRVLTNVLRNPTNYARSYVCFERSSWGGQLDLTYLVRAELLKDKTLFVEGVALAMLPLSSRFLESTAVPSDPDERTWRGLGEAAYDVLTTLFTEPLVKLCVSTVLRRPAPAAPTLPKKDRSRGVVTDYGATVSIRREVSLGEQTHYYAAVDEDMYLQVLLRRIMGQTIAFLRNAGVDTSEFEKKQQTIVNSTHIGDITNINQVSGGNNAFGTGSQVRST